MMNLNVKAVIFDMDGVITNTMGFHAKAWKDVLAEYNIEIDQQTIYEHEGQPGLIFLKHYLKSRNINFDMQQAQNILAKKEALYKEIFRLQFVEGSLEFISHLKQMGLPLALVTGTARHEMEHMLDQDLQDKFAYIVTGNDVSHGKPHPEPFLNALQGLNVLSDDAVVIENAPFGIESAKKAGIQTIALETSLPRSSLQRADFVFSSFQELEKNIQITRVEL